MEGLRKKLGELIAPTISVVIFCVIACMNLGQPIWYDEAYSAYIIRGSFSDIWQMTALDVHPPFYYFCLKIWTGLFGHSEFALRSMSVFFAAVGLVLAYVLFRRWFGKRTANLASFFMALSPFLVRYAQEARMYGLVFAIVIGASLVLDVALKEKKKLAWFCYAILIALGMWTHYFAALAWIAHLLYIAYYLHEHGLRKDVFWMYPLAVFCFLPWLPTAIKQFLDVQNGFWIPEVSINTPVGIFTQGLMLEKPENVTDWRAFLLIATLCAVMALAIRKCSSIKAKDRKNVSFLSVMVAIPPLALIILSLPPFKPTFVARYVTYSIALMMGLIAYIVALPSKKKGRVYTVITAMLVLACVGFGIAQTLSRSSNSATKDIITRTEQASAATILFDGDEMDDLDAFFYETDASPVYEVDIDFKWGALEPIRRYGQNYTEDINGLLANRSDFWYIVDKSFEKSIEFPGFSPETTLENDQYLATYFKKTN